MTEGRALNVSVKTSSFCCASSVIVTVAEASAVASPLATGGRFADGRGDDALGMRECDPAPVDPFGKEALMVFFGTELYVCIE